MKTAEKPARIVAREPIVDRKQQLYGLFRIGEMGSRSPRSRLEP
jgi:hypothetical protein